MTYLAREGHSQQGLQPGSSELYQEVTAGFPQAWLRRNSFLPELQPGLSQNSCMSAGHVTFKSTICAR